MHCSPLTSFLLDLDTHSYLFSDILSLVFSSRDQMHIKQVKSKTCLVTKRGSINIFGLNCIKLFVMEEQFLNLAWNVSSQLSCTCTVSQVRGCISLTACTLCSFCCAGCRRDSAATSPAPLYYGQV